MLAPCRPMPARPRSTRGGAARAADPFAAAPAAAAAPPGFLAASQRDQPLLPAGEASALLATFDAEWMAAQRSQRSSAPHAAPSGPQPQLRSACVALSARAAAVMLGLCAANSEEGLAALKAWTGSLGLPRKLLHGMDKEGVPTPVPGPVFIKYNSASGDAYLSGYGGEARGVLFTPTLPDGEFRQYGYLPVELFSE